MNHFLRTAALLVGVGSALSGPALALAHPVGDASEPNCHGQRVSHGANHSPIQEGHGLTPVERRDAVEVFLGEDITVGEWNKFIKTCPAPEGTP